MSIRAWGAFKVSCAGLSADELINLSFQATMLATRNCIGIKLGVNTTPEFYLQFKQTQNYLPFELVNNPLTNVADVLFIGDCIKLHVNDKRVDYGESLNSRMSRVQRFLDDILHIEIVERIILHIDGDVGEESEIEIQVSDYTNIMLELYMKENNYTPTVKYIISR